MLLGSDDGLAWTPRDTRAGELFATRFERRVFTLAVPAAYERYRLRIDRVAAPAAANCVQLAELELLQDTGYAYAWTFGDGATSTLQNPSHLCAAAGVCTAALTVADADTTATITVLTPYQVWRATVFNSAQLADATISAPFADPDADGLVNLLEYALAAASLIPETTTNVRITNIGPGLQITFLRARADLTYTEEASSDLVSWTNLATNPGTVSLAVPVTFSATVAPGVSENPRRGGRLRPTARNRPVAHLRRPRFRHTLHYHALALLLRPPLARNGLRYPFVFAPRTPAPSSPTFP